MRCLVIRIENTHLAFLGDGANQVVAALEHAEVVDYKGWFNDDEDYIIQPNAPIEIKFVDHKRIKYEEVSDENDQS